MSRLLDRAGSALLLVLLWPSAAGSEGPGPTLPGVSALAAAGALSPSAGWAVFRLLASLAVVGLLLAGCLFAYRWLARGSGRAAVLRSRGRTPQYPRWFSRWIPSAAADADRITIVTRSHVGARESLCLVEVGHERFLIGVTATAISLLGRLAGAERDGAATVVPVEDDPAADRGAGAAWELRRSPREPRALEAEGPLATDFSSELLRVTAPGASVTESSIRTALARSRDRLARLSQGNASRA